MNKDFIPKDLDVFISLLGEIDMIKTQVIALDKSTHIALSQDEVSTTLGNSRCFNILKLPDYKSKKILKEKMLYSIRSNSGFGLT